MYVVVLPPLPAAVLKTCEDEASLMLGHTNNDSSVGASQYRERSDHSLLGGLSRGTPLGPSEREAGVKVWQRSEHFVASGPRDYASLRAYYVGLGFSRGVGGILPPLDVRSTSFLKAVL